MNFYDNLWFYDEFMSIYVKIDDNRQYLIWIVLKCKLQFELITENVEIWAQSEDIGQEVPDSSLL